ncbi:MAG: hypothetical protein IPH07_23485 [Deltaproteobacteria bacterium]|nr:hypothetical protein [Deltaproteobacteria bacterium]MBK8241730.1 hypothetical protein [Deltaproteobacteria bacterium]
MDFPVKLGARNGGNSRLIRALQSGVIRDAFVGNWVWVQRLRETDFTPDADTAQSLTLSTLFPANPFPTNVIRENPLVYVASPAAGGSLSAVTLEFGDAADPNGLMTSTSIFTGASGFLQTTGAAEFTSRFEAAFDPTVDIATTSDDVDAIEGMDLWLMIQFTPVASVG